MQASPVIEIDPDRVLGKATARAAAMLGLNGKTLATVIGFSEPTISRILDGDRGINPRSKEGELAVLLVRLFRSLDAMVGGIDAKRSTWIGTHNKALNGVPSQLIKTTEGLVRTVAYLDGMRAPN